jgi:hypothetical protein
MFDIDPIEIARYEKLADQGKVIRTLIGKRGRWIVVFTMKEPPVPPPIPSKSQNSSCALTNHDSEGIAAMNFSEQRTSKRQIERWIGFGLLPGLAS